jgi:uncharacterized protein YdhG (YjbR/CyaY superfamily)
MPAGSVAKVEAYIAGLPAPARAALDRLRTQIRAAAPKAEEGFGYGLPGFYLDGPLFYYGAAKGHCALYGTVPDGFDDALSAFDRSKGTVRFMPDAPIPAATVKRLVKAKVAENKARAKAKAGAKVKGRVRKGKDSTR